MRARDALVGGAAAGMAYQALEWKKSWDRKAEAEERSRKMRKEDVVVIGCGFSGICAGVKLMEAGIPFVIIEKEPEVGGTWFLNQYPGCACDIPAHLYSLSFATKTDWSTPYAPQAEILEYLIKVVDSYGLRRHIRLKCEMTETRWVEESSRYLVTCADGTTYNPRFIIGAVGGLHVPKYPNVDRSVFRGKQFHSAEWDATWQSKGRRVAVIGSAASAVQLIPEIAKDAEHVFVFQRTPNWIAPRAAPGILPRSSYSEFLKTVFKYCPPIHKLHRLMIYLLQESLFWPLGFFDANGVGAKMFTASLRRGMVAKCGGDRDLAGKIVPAYSPGCKRICKVDNYIETLTKDNVTLLTSALGKVAEDGVYDDSGSKYAVDTVIYATGFEVGSVGNSKWVGSSGDEFTGTDAAEDARELYLGIVDPHLPNAFRLLGPNTALGHNSVVLMIEAQVEYVVRILCQAIDNDIDTISIKPGIVEKYYDWVWKEFDNRVWTKGGCSSWYQNSEGKIFSLYPGSTIRYFRDINTAPGLLESYHIRSKL